MSLLEFSIFHPSYSSRSETWAMPFHLVSMSTPMSLRSFVSDSTNVSSTTFKSLLKRLQIEVVELQEVEHPHVDAGVVAEPLQAVLQEHLHTIKTKRTPMTLNPALGDLPPNLPEAQQQLVGNPVVAEALLFLLPKHQSKMNLMMSQPLEGQDPLVLQPHVHDILNLTVPPKWLTTRKRNPTVTTVALTTLMTFLNFFKSIPEVVESLEVEHNVHIGVQKRKLKHGT